MSRRLCHALLGLLMAPAACQRAPLDPAGLRPQATDPHRPSESSLDVMPTKGRPHKTPPTPEAIARAQVLFGQRCALCHGRAGRGDGIAAVNLRPTPTSLADAGWQRQTRDEDIAAIIVKGGAAIGKSLMMPASQDLAEEPETVAALVALVRSFAPLKPGE